jgi:aspartate kinase
MIIMKFGGTSNQDAAAMANVASIIEAHATQTPVVVISAIAQATNLLAQAGARAAEGRREEARQAVETLAGRHDAILQALIRNADRRKELSIYFQQAFADLGTLLQGVAILRELTSRTLDAIYSYGELLSSKLVAAVLQERGLKAQWFDTINFLITDDRFGSAMPFMDAVRERSRAIITPAVEQGIIPVTQGYIGATLHGLRTTMGRESSDYSASILGAALEADHIQIWTDVDGVLTADPRIVPGVKKVRALSFEEAFDLSYFGAKVLHPHTMIPAIEKNIPVSIYNSRKPKSTGTLISGIAPDTRTFVKSIAFKNEMAAVILRPVSRTDQYLFWEQCLSQLVKHGAHAYTMAASGTSLALAVPESSINENLCNDLSLVASLSVQKHKSLITLVGQHLNETETVPARLFRTLGQFRLAVISAGSSPTSISVLIDGERCVQAVTALHEEFFRALPDLQIFEELQ